VLTGRPGIRPGTRTWPVSALLVGAIVAGSAIGLAPGPGRSGSGGMPGIPGGILGGAVDPLLHVLLVLIVVEARFDGLTALRRAPWIAALAWALNFAVVPLLGWGLTSALLPGDTGLRIGVLLYLLAPCTDWFLGFTRLAGGDTALGAALIPLNLLTQLALFPLWLALATGSGTDAVLDRALPALVEWFALPVLVGLALRLLLRALPPRVRTASATTAGRLVPLVVAGVVVAVFAANAGELVARPAAVGAVLLVVAAFFAVMLVLGEVVARAARLTRPAAALLTMTTSARNAPLMIALAGAALPGHPLVIAGLVVGMLLEFPHLTVLVQLLRSRRAAGSDATPRPLPSERFTRVKSRPWHSPSASSARDSSPRTSPVSSSSTRPSRRSPSPT
jgi:arsenite transporter